MAERGGGAGFALEALDHAVAVDQRRRHHLDGDLAVQRHLVRQVDRGHAAAAELAQHVVFTEGGLAEELLLFLPHAIGAAGARCRCDKLLGGQGALLTRDIVATYRAVVRPGGHRVATTGTE